MPFENVSPHTEGHDEVLGYELIDFMFCKYAGIPNTFHDRTRKANEVWKNRIYSWVESFFVTLYDLEMGFQLSLVYCDNQNWMFSKRACWYWVPAAFRLQQRYLKNEYEKSTYSVEWLSCVDTLWQVHLLWGLSKWLR